MRICYFGTYSTIAGYPRNRVIIKGLKDNGVQVVECHKELWKDSREKIQATQKLSFLLKITFKVISTYICLVLKFFSIGSYDFIIVGYTGHFDIFLAKILNIFKRKPVVFDAFLSIYDTLVMDRKIINKNSLKSRILWLVDKYSCKAANIVILDTNEHIEYFVREFGLPREKFIRVFVGEDDSIFKYERKSEKRDYFNVLFFGTYIPLHGIEYIIKSAGIIKENTDIVFTLIGTGHLINNVLSLASDLKLENVRFISQWVDYGKLSEYIKNADVCLGIFGDTEKAKRVIPCKVYSCLAMGKPIITGDSPAARELLINGENAILCNMADAEDLANAILKLKNNSDLREKIKVNAYKTYKSFASPEAIGKNLLDSLKGKVR